MGQILHGCATTTEAVRRAIQNSQESLRGLAKRYGINQKTVAKWKQGETVTDRLTDRKEAKSTVLSIEEEAIIVAFRQHTLLPLDDCTSTSQSIAPVSLRSCNWPGRREGPRLRPSSKLLLRPSAIRSTRFSPTMGSNSPSHRAMRTARQQDTRRICSTCAAGRTGSNIG